MRNVRRRALYERQAPVRRSADLTVRSVAKFRQQTMRITSDMSASTRMVGPKPLEQPLAHALDGCDLLRAEAARDVDCQTATAHSTISSPA